MAIKTIIDSVRLALGRKKKNHAMNQPASANVPPETVPVTTRTLTEIKSSLMRLSKNYSGRSRRR
jgi:hypothetical protein